MLETLSHANPGQVLAALPDPRTHSTKSNRGFALRSVLRPSGRTGVELVHKDLLNLGGVRKEISLLLKFFGIIQWGIYIHMYLIEVKNKEEKKCVFFFFSKEYRCPYLSWRKFRY